MICDMCNGDDFVKHEYGETRKSRGFFNKVLIKLDYRTLQLVTLAVSNFQPVGLQLKA